MDNNQQQPVDIFSDDTTVPASDWFKFENPGDAITGVLLEEPQYDVPGKFGPQNVYTLENTEGHVFLIGLNPRSHVRAVRQLKQAEVGDTVGIKFISFYDSGKGNPGKNLEVRIRHANITGTAQPQESEPFPSGPAKATPAPAPATNVTPAMKLTRIIEIAKAKLGASTDDDAKAKVMEATTMPLIESRYDEILNVLESMAKL